ncbi:hypothetical protein [Providencia sp. PROV138]|uniref:hypothetical protein n=1 Tax=Providencia sp. PROV138 TaxID=2949848 RepID=UPI00234BB693|nr:hypothetical protein [Providencia sp. PROV138]
MKGILFHKDYEINDLDNCGIAYDLLEGSKQPLSNPSLKHLERKLKKCLPRGKAYNEVYSRELYNRMEIWRVE